MPEVFTGIYYNGKTPQPYPARVQFMPETLQIIYYTQNNTLPVNVYWQLHRLQNKNTTATSKAQLQYGAEPVQILEIDNPEFWRQLQDYYTPKVASTPPEISNKNKIPVWFWTILMVLLTLIPVTYFWVLPAFADFAARRLPAKYEQTLGTALHQRVMALEKIDSIKTKQLQGFARQLHFKADYPIKFTVVQKDEVNAYAVPGGNIVVQTGILRVIKKPEELAALLAHEYSHIKLRHTTRTLFRSLAGYLFISMLLGDISGITAIIVENAHSLKNLQYSRKLETEADEWGLKILLQQRINPFGMVRLLNYLAPNDKNEPVTILSTHPSITDRQTHLQKILAGRKFNVAPNDSLQHFWNQLNLP